MSSVWQFSKCMNFTSKNTVFIKVHIRLLEANGVIALHTVCQLAGAHVALSLVLTTHRWPKKKIFQGASYLVAQYIWVMC